jgi:hypothetical protein
VTGIHPRLTEAEVTRLFEKYGEVEKCQIMRDPHTKESRGFGFVKMVTSDQADAAKDGLQGEVIEGRTLSIEKARRARPRTPTPGKYFGPPKRGTYISPGHDRFFPTFALTEPQQTLGAAIMIGMRIAAVAATVVAKAARTLTDTVAGTIVARTTEGMIVDTTVDMTEEPTARSAPTTAEPAVATVMNAPTTAASGMMPIPALTDTEAARSVVVAMKDARTAVLLPEATSGIDTTALPSARLARPGTPLLLPLVTATALPAAMPAESHTKLLQPRSTLLGIAPFSAVRHHASPGVDILIRLPRC